jgi:hypothetical protein
VTGRAPMPATTISHAIVWPSPNRAEFTAPQPRNSFPVAIVMKRTFRAGLGDLISEHYSGQVYAESRLSSPKWKSRV